MPIPKGLQLDIDLACLIVRLEQIQGAGGFEEPSIACMADRVLTCDLPRLREHLSEDARGFITALREGLRRG